MKLTMLNKTHVERIKASSLTFPMASRLVDCARKKLRGTTNILVAQAAVNNYVRAMKIKSHHEDINGELLALPPALDAIWRAHMTESKEYEVFCRKITKVGAGRFLHRTSMHADLKRAQMRMARHFVRPRPGAKVTWEIEGSNPADAIVAWAQQPSPLDDAGSDFSAAALYYVAAEEESSDDEEMEPASSAHPRAFRPLPKRPLVSEDITEVPFIEEDKAGTSQMIHWHVYFVDGGAFETFWSDVKLSSAGVHVAAYESGAYASLWNTRLKDALAFLPINTWKECALYHNGRLLDDANFDLGVETIPPYAGRDRSGPCRDLDETIIVCLTPRYEMAQYLYPYLPRRFFTPLTVRITNWHDLSLAATVVLEGVPSMASLFDLSMLVAEKLGAARWDVEFDLSEIRLLYDPTVDVMTEPYLLVNKSLHHQLVALEVKAIHQRF